MPLLSRFWKVFAAAPWPAPARRIACGMAAALALGLLASCYDPNAIESLTISPDGRWAALTTARDELGVLDLAEGGSLRIDSNFVKGAPAWSPDSRRLAFVEQYPNHEPQLWTIDPARGRAGEPLLSSSAWLARPQWIAPDSLLYLSDRDAELVNLWRIELTAEGAAAGPPTRVLARPADLTGLWSVPARGGAVVQSFESGSSELWWWDGSGEPRRLTRDPEGQSIKERLVTPSPDGSALAWVAAERRANGWLVAYDIDGQRVSDQLRLESPAGSLAWLADGRLAATLGSALLLWNRDPGLLERATRLRRFDGLPLGLVAARGEGVSLVLNRNLLLDAADADDLKASELHARRREDMIALAAAYAELGDEGEAGDLLAELWEQTRPGSRTRLYVGAARSQLERRRGHWRAADQWLEQALESARPESYEAAALWQERLALASFEARRDGQVQWVLSHMPPDSAEEPLSAWVRELLPLPGRPSGERAVQRAWLRVAAELREGAGSRRHAGGAAPAGGPAPGGESLREAAAGLHQRFIEDGVTTLGMRALGLVLDGQFEPLGEPDRRNARQLAALLGLPNFQLAMLRASRAELQGVQPTPADLRIMLLTQWIREGDLSSARLLVREDLTTATTSAIDYGAILRQFLIAEEAERWIEQAVARVLLAEDIARRLETVLTSPGDRMALELAKAKSALIEGDAGRAERALESVEAMMRGAADAGLTDAGSGPDDVGAVNQWVFRRAPDQFLVTLFRAKLCERRRDWDSALRYYGLCQSIMAQEPYNWDIAANEVSFAIGLIQDGRGDPELLGEYVAVLRGMGDPLINPSHAPETLRAALNNLRTLDAYSPQAWFRPYLLYSQGLCWSMLEDPQRAVVLLRQARALNPEPSLLQRIILEEAAIRDGNAQHALAARLYDRLAELSDFAPARATAMLARLQSELNCGAARSAERRIEELLAERPLPDPWRTWLRLQVGGAPIEGGTVAGAVPGNGELD